MNKITLFTLALIASISLQLKAQNTGPVAPEAVSFEPVDATDMVNLVTGDLSYVIPLLNVPSPEGGYPIALSYHGGVTMDQEASWVGLGWNLNPGALNRKINGVPDDWNNKTQLKVVFADGEEHSLYKIGAGVSFGEKNVASVGLSYTWGDYKAFGGNVYFGHKESGIGAGISFSTRGSVGLNVGDAKSGMSAGISLSSHDGIGMNAGMGSLKVGVNSNSGLSATVGGSTMSVGISLNSQGLNGGLTIGGIGTLMTNHGAIGNDDLTIFQNSGSIAIPIYIFYVSFDFYELEYFLYRKYYDYYYGSLYLERPSVMGNSLHKMDSYTIPYNRLSIENPENDVKKNNLLLTAYDDYIVNAQGLNARFSPKLYSKFLLEHDEYNVNASGTESVSYYETESAFTKDPEMHPNFYFDKEISGYMKESTGSFTGNSLATISYDGKEIDSEILYNDELYTTYSNNRKVSGNYIEWFTNREIADGSAQSKGLILDEKYNADRGNQDKFDQDGIGGFKITTLDGKTYHYSLPVYQLEEFMRKNGDKPGDFMEIRKRNPYAYTWLLTAITGPDFIDKDSDGFVDNDDYGYWMKFEYGKYTDSYLWMFPYDLEGAEYDTYDKEIQWGRKQMYYLNTIESRTHIAYFVKEKRNDGLGKIFSHESNEHHLADYWTDIDDNEYIDSDGEYLDEGHYFIDIYEDFTYHAYESEQPLALNRIILLNKDDAQIIQIAESEEKIIGLYTNTRTIKPRDKKVPLSRVGCYYEDAMYCEATGEVVTGYFYQGDCTNPCDPDEIVSIPASGTYFKESSVNLYSNSDEVYLSDNVSWEDIEAKALKVIKFNYNYDLCENTPNSNADSKGKLTLMSFDIQGKNNHKVLPSYSFNYNKLGSNNYDLDLKDKWGYDKYNPENWSLSTISLPLGAKIKINYERNNFNNEAVYGNQFPVIQTTWTKVKPGCDINSLSVGESYLLTGSLDITYFIQEVDDYGEVIREYPREETSLLNHFVTILSIDEDEETIEFDIIEDNDWNTTDLSSNEEINHIHKNLDNAYFQIDETFIQNGGGVRVKQIELVDQSGTKHSTNYNYLIPESNVTSGTICYSPYLFGEKYIPYVTELPIPKVMYKYVTVTEKSPDNYLFNTIYEFNTYENKTFEDGIDYEMGNQFQVINDQYPDIELGNEPGDNGGPIYARVSTIVDNFSTVGRLKSVITKNTLNQTTSSTIYNYYEPEEIPIGVQQETYTSLKKYSEYYDDFNKSDNIWQYNATSKLSHPNILKSKKIISDGVLQEISFNKHDFYSGNVLSTETKTLRGKTYKSEILPAYRIDAYNDMGPKAEDTTFMNMLSQQAAGITYLKDEENWLPIGVNIQTWNKSWNYRTYNSDLSQYQEASEIDVWRKHESYIWKGNIASDGTFGTDFDTYYNTTDKLKANWSLLSSDPKWEKVSEITRYNHFSMPLESKDINDHYVATKLDKNNQYVIATATNAPFRTFTYTGMENEMQGAYLDGEVVSYLTESDRVTTTSHTGAYSLKASSAGPVLEYTVDFNAEGCNYDVPYVVSFWVNSAIVDVNIEYTFLSGGSSVYSDSKYCAPSIITQFGDWKLIYYTLPDKDEMSGISGADELKIQLSKPTSTTMYFDDFRVHPVDAPMSSYAYDHHTGAVTAILDNNNIATKYEYDDAGRLIRVYKEVETESVGDPFKLAVEHDYSYARDDARNFELILDSVPLEIATPNILTTPITIKNKSIFAEACKVEFSLTGYESQERIIVLEPNVEHTFNLNWDLNSTSVGTNLTLAVTGDITGSTNIEVIYPFGLASTPVDVSTYDINNRYLNVAIPITNRTNVSDVCAINIQLQGETITLETATLDPGDIHTFNVDWTIAHGPQETRNVTITGNANEIFPVTIVYAMAEFALVNPLGKSYVKANRNITAHCYVKNIGNLPGDGSVTLDCTGHSAYTENFSLDPGQQSTYISKEWSYGPGPEITTDKTVTIDVSPGTDSYSNRITKILASSAVPYYSSWTEDWTGMENDYEASVSVTCKNSGFQPGTPNVSVELLKYSIEGASPTPDPADYDVFATKSLQFSIPPANADGTVHGTQTVSHTFTDLEGGYYKMAVYYGTEMKALSTAEYFTVGVPTSRPEPDISYILGGANVDPLDANRMYRDLTFTLNNPDAYVSPVAFTEFTYSNYVSLKSDVTIDMCEIVLMPSEATGNSSPFGADDKAYFRVYYPVSETYTYYLRCRVEDESVSVGFQGLTFSHTGQ